MWNQKKKYNKDKLYSTEDPEELFDLIQPLGKGIWKSV